MHFNNHVTLQPLKLFQAAGLEYAQSFLKDLGIEYPEMYYSNAISSSTSSSDPKYGASSEKMAAAYAAFANGGTYYKPSYIKSIKFEDGSTKSFDSKGVEAMSPQTAYMMSSMLKQVLTGGTATGTLMSLVHSMLVRLVHLTMVTMSTIRYKKKVASMLTLWFRMKLSLVTILSIQWRFGLVTKTVKHHFMIQTLISLNKSTV